ncbi:MAG TPA: nitroreductase [Clostridiaceae bacterium]|nr:nitroreductase [Clostridiaceae bacterium]
MNIKQAILLRKSIRTYKNEPLSKDLRDKLEDYIKNVKGPFGTNMRFMMIDTDNAVSGAKLGTYGVISGARTFICAVVEPEERYEENLGYAFEKIILYATSLGLGTCWLGGTFNRSGFSDAAGLKDKEFMPVITPVGYPGEKRSFVDQVFVMTAGSRTRKNWSELFFDKSFDKPLNEAGAEHFREALEMVRLAPSASNKQPWRIVKDGDILHFFIKRSVAYKNVVGFDIQRLDMGIAMCHLELTMNDLGYNGDWLDIDPKFSSDKNTGYIISYKLKISENS